MTYVAPAIPTNAPFSPAQQAWLNGFLAGLLGQDEQGGASSASAPNSARAADASAAAAPSEPEDLPWHDPGLALDERLKLAEGRALERRLMAAMAQLDCGQCGYLCRTYAEAIAHGEEKSLSRCVPGGKETARALKEMMSDAATPTGPAIVTPVVTSAASAPATVARPEPARFEGAARLNREGSEKDTRHVVIRFDGAPIPYQAGDALGVHVANCPETVDAVIALLGGKGSEEMECPDGSRRSLREALLEVCDIGRPSDQAVEVLASRARDMGEADRLQALAEGYPGAEPIDADLLDLLATFPSAKPPLQELVLALGVLQPRLYSIASSAKRHPSEVHLTVAAVRYRRRGRLRKGIASVFLAERAAPGAALPVFVKPAHGFALPRNPDAPIVMIGPGTGIAPFRGFLQDRRETGARGRNWLFFGDQRRACDFLYEEELLAYHRDGLLTRLDVAFSRDQAEKLYVQHRMREHAAELWAWLQEGAHLYVCGDAQRMARDVDTALIHLVAKQGGMAHGAAKTYLAGLARDGRYQRDVY